MADRIRANRLGRETYKEVVTSADTNANCDPGGTGCTTAALALHDKAKWLDALETALPGATGTIDCDATTNPATYTIVVSWAEAGQVDASTYELRFRA